MIRSTCLALLLSLSSVPVFATDSAGRLESVAKRFHQITGFSGAVLVMQGDQVRFRQGYGLADREHGAECTPGTVFRLASVTKQFTATAILRLAQDGRLDLQAPISTYLPELNPAIGQKVTIHHLLTHSGGIIRDVETLCDKDMGDHFTIEEMIGLISGSELQAEPGAGYAYSNAGYVLLAATIQRITGKLYGQAMEDLFFEPLGLKNTGHEIAGLLLPGRARGYRLLPDGAVNAPYEDKSYVTGAGSMYSTADDLGKWFRAVSSGAVLSPEMTQVLHRAHTPRVGYGWFMFEYEGHTPEGVLKKGRGVRHDGGCPGFATQVARYLDHDITVVVLCNTRPAPIPQLVDQLANVLLDNEVTYPPESVADAIYREALARGVKAASARWQALEKNSVPGIPSPAHMNRTGYRYLLSHQHEKALRVFQLQVAVFPDLANAHDSLGEAYLASGQRERGIACYRKALEIDPSFENARKVLEKLGVEAPKTKP